MLIWKWLETVLVHLSPKGSFWLAYTKRNAISVDDLCRLALEDYKLQGTIHEDYCIDIWDNAVYPESMFWRDAIIVFRRVEPPLVA